MTAFAPLVVAVVPAFNGWEFSQICLQALENSSYSNLQIVFVDDGSRDATPTELPAKFPRVHVVRGDGNLWWSRAMNLGIAAALARDADFIFVINNDVVAEQDAISELVACARRRPGAIVGSLILGVSDRSRVWCAGGATRWPWPGEMMVGGAVTDAQFSGEWSVQWTPGMGTLIPREVVTELGGYDAELFPQYLGDTDFTLRAGKKGHAVIVTSASKLYNHVENTGGLTLSGERMTLRQVQSIFRGIKSPDYLPSRLVFILRHCPWYWVVPALFIRYLRLSGFIVRNLTR